MFRMAMGFCLIAEAMLYPMHATAGGPTSRQISDLQCKSENGEIIEAENHECPAPEKFIADISGYMCPCICCGPAGLAQKLHPAVKVIAAVPHVAKRNGVLSVWGIDLELSEKLSPAIAPKNFSIVEDKHSHELSKLMDYSLADGGTRLRAKFKIGFGDFGSGNSVLFTIRAGTPLASGLKTEKDVSVHLSTDKR